MSGPVMVKKEKEIFSYLPQNLAAKLVDVIERKGYKAGQSDVPVVVYGQYETIGDTKFKKITKVGYVEVPKKEQERFVKEMRALGLSAEPSIDDPKRIEIRMPKGEEKKERGSSIAPKPKKEMPETTAEAATTIKVTEESLLDELKVALKNSRTESDALKTLKEKARKAYSAKDWSMAEMLYDAIWEHLLEKEKSKTSFFEKALFAEAAQRKKEISLLKLR
ncbi:MAG: hypothetical protein QW112_00495 [Candidatus Micrarchaeia archaeon]